MKATILNLFEKLSLVLLSTCLSLALLAPSAALAGNSATPNEPAGRPRPAACSSTAAQGPQPRASAQPAAEPISRRRTWWTTWWTGTGGW